jgi:hypothetical protein
MRTHRISKFAVVGAVLLAAGCGSSVTVVVTTEGADGPEAQANVPIQVLPFNRDSVFDALDTQASTPRPQMSAELQAERERVNDLQAQWQSVNREWADARDNLQQLSTRLQNMDSRDPDYRRLFDQFNQGESVVNRLTRELDSSFEAFTNAQEAVAVATDSFKIVRDLWEDEAYAGYFDIQTQLLGGAEVLEDTTDASGHASVSISGGDWWVSSRLPTAAGELYWNVLVSGDTVTLNESNGVTRDRL